MGVTSHLRGQIVLVGAVKGHLDKPGLVEAFRRLGLQPTCHVMVHASLSALGVVNEGAQTVVAALRQASGPEGSVIIPSFRGAIRADYYALRECQDHRPRPLCPSRERGYTGIVGETVRQQSDAAATPRTLGSASAAGPGLSWKVTATARPLVAVIRLSSG